MLDFLLGMFVGSKIAGSSGGDSGCGCGCLLLIIIFIMVLCMQGCAAVA